MDLAAVEIMKLENIIILQNKVDFIKEAKARAHQKQSLHSSEVPGGLIGVWTKIDPTLCRMDRVVSQVLGAVGKLPKVHTGDLAKIQLTSPACTEVGEKVALTRRIEKHWRLVGKYSCEVSKLIR
ncbi:hypothetical protein BDR06DRAFT_973700 [Suillus hirtellus]|nr:hypothetical protein BDR06DRAFT_973700 [Suillus hirtellus]